MLRYRREMVVGLLALGSFLPLLFIPPIPQDPAYHQFADLETVWGIPNFLNVVTSLSFVAVGLLGLVSGRIHQLTVAPWSWRTLFGAVALVGFGSAYYHWAPSHWTLVWDRLPMAVGFMALFVALLSENVNPKLETILLVPMCLLAIFSVVYWHFTDDLEVLHLGSRVTLVGYLDLVFSLQRQTHASSLSNGRPGIVHPGQGGGSRRPIDLLNDPAKTERPFLETPVKRMGGIFDLPDAEFTKIQK